MKKRKEEKAMAMDAAERAKMAVGEWAPGKPEQRKALAAYAFLSNGADGRSQEPDSDGKYIRIFRDETSPDVWKAYCEGLGIGDPSEIKSFKIKFAGSGSVEVDEYAPDGTISEP